ncbi:MAG: hypothetical protein IJD98_05710 [Oscillospiraceae bacterium]|nr:hypothetical protein [Oscillospiraceae bacterium]
MKAIIGCKVIEMTKVEAKKAGIVGTAEFDQLKELREAYPTFRIEVKASKSKGTMKGLTVPYMKKYIEAHDDAKKTNMTIFNALRGLDENGNENELARVATYGELKMWFLDTYPEVEDMNKTVDDILAKAKKNREAKRLAAAKAA